MRNRNRRSARLTITISRDSSRPRPRRTGDRSGRRRLWLSRHQASPGGGEGGWGLPGGGRRRPAALRPRADPLMVLDLDSDKVVGDIPNLSGVHGVALAPISAVAEHGQVLRSKR